MEFPSEWIIINEEKTFVITGSTIFICDEKLQLHGHENQIPN